MVLSMNGLSQRLLRLRDDAAQLLEAWRRWRIERRTQAELASLDDGALEDLGFQRVRLGPDAAVIVPVLDEAAVLGSPAHSNDNPARRALEGSLRVA